MEIKELEEMVDKDLELSADNLIDMSHKIPMIHNKYMKELNKAVYLLKKHQNNYNEKYSLRMVPQ